MQKISTDFKVVSKLMRIRQTNKGNWKQQQQTYNKIREQFKYVLVLLQMNRIMNATWAIYNIIRLELKTRKKRNELPTLLNCIVVVVYDNGFFPLFRSLSLCLLCVRCYLLELIWPLNTKSHHLVLRTLEFLFLHKKRFSNILILLLMSPPHKKKKKKA